MGEPASVDEQVPDAAVPLVHPDGRVTTTPLSALVEDRPTLVCFYTMDFSPDCIEEWCSFRDLDWFASGERIRVVGVSKSGVRLHRRFIDLLDLGFPLYADSDLELAEAFGVDYRALGVFRRSRRSCFLLDGDRTVRYRWLGEHWLDPSRDTPPLGDIRDAVDAELGEPKTDTSGFA
jgi:peroxiredoxin Q/BCP